MKTATQNNVKTKKSNTAAKSELNRLPEATTSLTQGNGKTKPVHEQIREVAYFNYLNEGRPNGRALQHWLDAEARLRGH